MNLFNSAGKMKKIVFVFLCVFVLFNVSICLASGNSQGGTKGWVATDTYRWMNFGVLAIVLFLLLKKPASQALNGRIRSIEKELEELETRKSEAKKILNDYEKRIENLNKEAEIIVAQYVKDGEDAKKRILKEAEDSVSKLEKQSQIRMDNEFKSAKLSLHKDIIEKAFLRAEEIVKTKITPNDQHRLIDEYLNKVVAK
ncbi:MAG: ATP synthase F0 subunit B [Desulfobacterales bacterium]|nr:ATP synthase F0 subunit B [Desulfobacterales bacterium]